MQAFARYTSNSTYGGFSSFITTFNIGGYDYSGYDLGKELAILCINTLTLENNNNNNASNYGIRKFNSNNKLIINKDLMVDYKIDLNSNNILLKKISNGKTTFARKEDTIRLSLLILFITTIISLIIKQYYIKKTLKEQIKLDTMKTSFIANVSHELRTPLNIIISTIQLLDIYIKDNSLIINNPKVNEKLSYLKSNSNRLLRLVNNIIDMTKIDAGYYTINPRLNNFINILEEIALSTVPYAEKRHIDLVFDTDIEELFFLFDKDKIERIFLNLLSNAIKFTPPNGLINVTISHSSKTVIVFIKDNGIGIPKNMHSAIFQRFRQVDNAIYNKSEGSGIGLAICKSLVEMHNGTISVISSPNEGTTFKVELPLNRDDINSSPYINDLSTNIAEIEYSDLSNYI